MTRRLARLIHGLCEVMTVADVTRHLGLNWKTVKEIDKAFLEDNYGQTSCEGLRILAIDEIAVRKGHSYMTVIVDYETGRVIWMGEGRSKRTLRVFFAGMNEKQRQGLEAVAMDMHEPYIQAVGEAVPHVEIVFDLFHVVSAYNKLIDRVRIDECQKATLRDRRVFRGTKYLLLRRRLDRPRDRRHLDELLELNRTLFFVYVLRELLIRIWQYRRRADAARALASWCKLARAVGHPALKHFARMLERHREGILSHCHYPIHTSRLEGINNKIKVIKRKAYGYHDTRYFVLKVKQAFDPEANSLFGR